MNRMTLIMICSLVANSLPVPKKFFNVICLAHIHMQLLKQSISFKNNNNHRPNKTAF